MGLFSNCRASKQVLIFHQSTINLNIVNSNARNVITTDSPKPDNGLAIFAMILQVLLEFLELKYQGKDEVPFETHPKIMSVAITSLLIYSVSYFIKQKVSSSNCSPPVYASVVNSSMAIFFPLLLATLSSLLLPDSTLPALFMLALLLVLSDLPNLRLQKFFTTVLKELVEKFQPRFSPLQRMYLAPALLSQ